MPSDPPTQPPANPILTPELVEKFKAQLDAMKGKEIIPGGPIEHTLGAEEAAWYIAYSTSA